MFTNRSLSLGCKEKLPNKFCFSIMGLYFPLLHLTTQSEFYASLAAENVFLSLLNPKRVNRRDLNNPRKCNIFFSSSDRDSGQCGIRVEDDNPDKWRRRGSNVKRSHKRASSAHSLPRRHSVIGGKFFSNNIDVAREPVCSIIRKVNARRIWTICTCMYNSGRHHQTKVNDINTSDVVKQKCFTISIKRNFTVSRLSKL